MDDKGTSSIGARMKWWVGRSLSPEYGVAYRKLSKLIIDNLEENDVYVDVASGTGELLLRIHDKARKVIGVDNNLGMILSTQRRFELKGIEAVILDRDITEAEWDKELERDRVALYPDNIVDTRIPGDLFDVGSNNTESKLSQIENQLFHDFSALEKALKKYAKIAIENENLILEYLDNPIFKISEILDKLKDVIDQLGLDDKKKEKALAKIHELDGVYFNKIKEDFKNAKQRSNDVKYEIENNKGKKELDDYNKELNNVKINIESVNNKISMLNNDLEKINIEKLKENLVNEVNDVIKVRIVIR